jgi:ribosomal protein S18 acetylase RimI-like enzyme
MLGGMADVSVTRCPANQRVAALQLLLAARDGADADSLAQAVNSAGPYHDAAWDGLLVAGRPAPSSALWVQFVAGNAATIWPPPANDPAAGALFRAAAELVDQRGLDVAQMVVDAAAGFSASLMAESGFLHLVDLRYLFAAASPSAHSPQSAHPLQFRPHAEREPAQLAAIIERTYVDSRDCPTLDGVRHIADVLEGYRGQGTHLPEHWYLVSDGPQDVGVVLFANHPAAGSWELVYMGIVPEARGRGYGEAIAQFARETAARHGAERVVLAVDAANGPAVAMYERAGFREWQRRTVFARLARPRSQPSRG